MIGAVEINASRMTPSASVAQIALAGVKDMVPTSGAALLRRQHVKSSAGSEMKLEQTALEER